MQGLKNFAQGAKFIFLSLWFRKACEISYRVQNSFFTVSLSILQLVLLLAFRIAMQNCWMLDFFSDSVPCILDWFGKGYEALQNLDSYVFELQLALLWTIQNSPSFLARFNDKKVIKNTKTCQKLIRNICKGL